MQLLHFFTCCFSTTTVKEDPPKTPYELLFENENPRFKSFSNVENKNSNIEKFYYNKDDYNNVLKDINNTQESLWKSRILTYTIRNNQVFMYYDPYKMGFTYYCVESLPYYLLNIIAMKYVRVFYCYDFFMDNQKIYFENTELEGKEVENKGQLAADNDNINNNEIKQENNYPNFLYKLHYIELDKKNKPITNGPFAKLKKNNINTTVDKTKNNKNKDTEDGKINKNDTPEIPTIPRCKNKFIHGGNLYNFEVLKKEKTEKGFRSPVIDNMKGFSYKDFKALQK